MLLASALVTSCGRAPLSVRTEFVDPSYLASSHVETPDYCRSCFYGQQLVIRYRASAKGALLKLSVRYENYEMQEVEYACCSKSGFWIFRPNGVVTGYRVTLYENDRCISQFSHMWAEILSVGDRY